MVEANCATTVYGVGNDCQTGQIRVPADVERYQDLSIDDDVRVVMTDVGKYVDTASFVGTFTSGSRITVPAEFVRETGLKLGETYMVGFESVEMRTVSELIEDDDSPEEAEEVEDEPETLGKLFETSSGEMVDSDDSEEAEDETEGSVGDESLGELFG